MVSASCPKADRALRWFFRISKKSCTFKELEKTDGFVTIDAMIGTQIRRMDPSPLKEQIEYQEEKCMKKERQLRGRQMLWMMLKHFKSDPERANVLDTRKFLLL